MSEHDSYIQAVKTFNRWLESKHLRKTQERFAILKASWALGGHFGAEDLRRQLENGGYHVSRATVYNTLGLLEDCGVLRRHHFGSAGGEALFEIASGTHLHLICTRCGSITEQAGKDEVSTLLDPARYSGFVPAYLSAYIYGLCDKCMAEDGKNRNLTPEQASCAPHSDKV